MNMRETVTIIQDQKLGRDGGDISLATQEDNREAALALAGESRYTLHIYTRDLDHPVYDTDSFVEAVSQLARRAPQTHVYILVQDSQRVVKNGHRLVDLARRLTSHIEIRKPHEDYKDYNEAFLVADERGVIHRELADRHEGSVNFNAPLKARHLVKYFMEVWERSEPDPELRRLYL